MLVIDRVFGKGSAQYRRVRPWETVSVPRNEHFKFPKEDDTFLAKLIKMQQEEI